MPVKIDFGKSEAPEAMGNEAEKAKMQECIGMIEAGEGEKAIPILQSLIAGEDAETEEEATEEKSIEKESYRQAIAKKI
jgi:hypothetical protein